ncbi:MULTISPECIES: NB-ARC domain-containing protein [unclassified Sphingobacterium]|uniref:NB-ARC domain-containing protein n=1 Tax=unclassified Sphingobacterium TaxID=2609468 RepID=UPI0025F71B9D|nr:MULTISPECIES: NB-ARC domain-containing protein [unclassified Sphingobacterium]
MNFKPFDQMLSRLESSKSDSDLAYFYDLLLYGECLTKTISLYLVSAINEDNERTRYRQYYSLVRGSSIGEYARSIDDVLTGPPAQLLCSEIRDFELKELMQRSSGDDWQYQAIKNLHRVLEIFKIPHDEIPLKSPLRNWFGMFVYLRNKTKGHGATTIEPCTAAAPLLELSIDLIVQNLTTFKRPWAYLHRNYSGKYRISSISNKAEEFNFLKSENHHHFENGIYCFLDKPRKIELMFSDAGLSDFFYTNGNLKNENYESISYFTDERQKSDAKEYLIPITELPSSHTEGKNELEVLGDTFTNLPRSSDEYVKRESLEDELLKVLGEKDRFPIVTLLGRGGIGKTSLALNVVRALALKESLGRYDLIIWFSSRDIDLLIEGPKQVQTKVLNQKDIADEYCKLAYPNERIANSLDFFSKELTKNSIGSTLYIFDNFETVTNPVEVFEWINTYIRNPNKCLITSRISRNFKADYPIEIHGMNDYECRELIKIVSDKLEINNLLSEEYIENLIIESDGHPYIIKILLGEVAKTKKIGKINRIVADQDKILTALFKRTFNTLSPAAKRVFLTLCSWNTLIPKIAVEAVLWRPENEKIDVQGGIDELLRSSFIELLNEDSDEAMINVPLAATIFGKNELEVYPEKIKIFDDRKLLMEFGATSQSTISNGLTPKIDRKFIEVAKRIDSVEDFKKELSTLEYIASKYARAHISIADIFEEYNDYESVKYYLREYLKTALPTTEKAKIWHRLANVCKIEEDWEGESHALSELVLLPNIEFHYISDACNRINNYFYNHPEAKDIEYKKLLLDKVIETMKKRIHEGEATDYSRLAWLLLNNNQETEAIKIAEKGLELDRNSPYCRKILEKLVEYKSI